MDGGEGRWEDGGGGGLSERCFVLPPRRRADSCFSSLETCFESSVLLGSAAAAETER